MKEKSLTALFIIGALCLLMVACTPPPPSDSPEPDNGATDTETQATDTEVPDDPIAGAQLGEIGEPTIGTEDGTTIVDGVAVIDTSEPDETEEEENGDEDGDDDEDVDGDEDVDDHEDGDDDEDEGDDEDVDEDEDEDADEDEGEEIEGSIEEEPMIEAISLPDNLFGHYETWPPENITDEEIEILRQVVCVLETTKGTIRIRLFPDAAPIHSANFVKLIQEGFYDGLTFHRIIEGFMSQGGDPEGTGSGGPGYTLPAEIGLPHEAGRVSAARLGDEMNPERRSSGSQFYLCHTTEGVAHLDGDYSVFGQIIEGQDVNLALNVSGPGVEPDKIDRAYVELGD